MESKLIEVLSGINRHPDLHEACQTLLDLFRIKYVPISPANLPVDAFFEKKVIENNKPLFDKITEVCVVGIATEETFIQPIDGAMTFEELDQKNINDHYKEMAFFSIDANAEMTRTEISNLTRTINRRMVNRPVVIFIRHNNLLSMATCERSTYVRSGFQGEKPGKVTILRNIDCINPHRGHINILCDLDLSGCKSYDELYAKWLNTFSNELLTKKFYNELSDWYAWAVQVARFPNDLSTTDDDAMFNHESCIRLITRLIFVWFIKQKNLIPSELFDEDFIRDNFINDFNPHDRVNLIYNPESSKYYRLIIQNLFFAMLNRPIVAEDKSSPNNRRFRKPVTGHKNSDYNVNNLMRYESEFKDGGANKFLKMANKNVPFLNGGLFDCLDDKPRNMYYDGFSERKDSLEQLFVPDYLFFGEEVGNGIDLSQWYGDTKKKKVSARGIIDILKRYSFTIEENTPLDQEVSLDPELLGKVFENLLASFNPETKTSARKQTGSFYTPREIVQYMVDESLVAHLKRMCGDEMEQKYRDLLSYSTDEVQLTSVQTESIMSAIYNCRVLDPACGSGAFPMGMLHQMVHVLKRIDPSNKMWNSLMVDVALEETRKELKKAAGNELECQKIEDNQKARLKDIENAFNQSINDPDYARKLFLIERCIYGVDIQPIATQISKLRFFISLVVDQKPTDDPKNNFGIRPLPNLEAKFVSANTLIPLDRTQDLFTSSDDVRYYEEMLQDLNHRIFLSKRNKEKEELRSRINSTRALMALDMENLGILGSKGYNQLINWNMFDQNASAPFFDPEWMFGVKEGFDIVIGNPPYAQVPKGMVVAKDYPYSEGKDKGKQNLYKLFIERSYNLLRKNGFACLIVQSSLMGDVSAAFTRELILMHSSLKQIIEFPKSISRNDEDRAFASVLQGTCIVLFEKIEKPNEKVLISIHNSLQSLKFPTFGEISAHNIYNFSPLHEIPIISQEGMPIYIKVKSGNSPLESILVDSAQGNINTIHLQKIQSKTETGAYIAKGAHVHRYCLDSELYNCQINENTNRIFERNLNENIILTQNITGTTDTNRIHAVWLECRSTRIVLLDSVNISYLPSPEEAAFACGLLNSKLLDWIFRITSTNNHVNLYELNNLPLPLISNKNKGEVVKLVKIMMSKKGINRNADISDHEAKLDLMVYKFYGLTYDEVLVVDPNPPFSREEYDNFQID